MPEQNEIDTAFTLPAFAPVLRKRVAMPAAFPDEWSVPGILSGFNPHDDLKPEHVLPRGLWRTLPIDEGSSFGPAHQVVYGEGAQDAYRVAINRLGMVPRPLRQRSSGDTTVHKMLSRAVLHETESIWRAVQACLDEDEDHEKLQHRFLEFLDRYGANGVRALSALILGRLPSTEAGWFLLRIVGEASDPRTIATRRDLLAAALESRDAGLRYAAASALGELGDEMSLSALRRRLQWEKNASVRRIINAELRG